MKTDPSALLQSPALDPLTVPVRKGSTYPREESRAMTAGRLKRALGDATGLRNFGVNLVHLEPGAASALRHWHTRQDEFIYVLEGEITLITDAGPQVLRPGICAGFPAGKADGHHLVNHTQKVAVYIEVGDRLPGDDAYYSGVDMTARGGMARYEFLHADGRPYEKD